MSRSAKRRCAISCSTRSIIPPTACLSIDTSSAPRRRRCISSPPKARPTSSEAITRTSGSPDAGSAGDLESVALWKEQWTMPDTRLRIHFREPTVDLNLPITDGTVRVEGYKLEFIPDESAEYDVWD